MIISFTVPGKPVPKARPRVTMHGTYTPQSTREFEQRVRLAWKLSGAGTFPGGLPLCVFVDAAFPIPASLSRRKREAMDGEPHIRRGDLDNVVKAVLDALNGLAYPDDAAVTLIRASKFWAPEPHTRIQIISTKEDFT